MGFTTPRGRQIDISRDKAFAIMGRISKHNSKYDAYYILRTCEAIDNFPQIIAYIFGIAIAFYPSSRIWMIPIALAVGTLIGSLFLISTFHPLVVRPLLPIFRIWNMIPELIRLLSPPLVVFFLIGWYGALFWMIGLVVAQIINMTIIAFAGRMTYRKTGSTLGQADRCFLQACEICAMKAGVDFDMYNTWVKSENTELENSTEDELKELKDQK